jgi:hypothetical protein
VQDGAGIIIHGALPTDRWTYSKGRLSVYLKDVRPMSLPACMQADITQRYEAASVSCSTNVTHQPFVPYKRDTQQEHAQPCSRAGSAIVSHCAGIIMFRHITNDFQFCHLRIVQLQRHTHIESCSDLCHTTKRHRASLTISTNSYGPTRLLQTP